MAVRGSVQRVQDAVHGLMEFRGLEASLIEVMSAKELQRLRRIRQLGLVHLVFPSAEHSRLVHSLGAAHVALRFARRLEHVSQDFLAFPLRPDEETRRDLALAALCHDLGHGPLSHVWEQEVVRNFDVPAWVEKLGLPSRPNWGEKKWHELVGQAILLNPETDIHRSLKGQEEDLPSRIAGMLRGAYHLEYLPALLSGDVDVDRCDYVLRDANAAGVQYGRYDLDWLISISTIGSRNDQLVVGFDERKAPRIIEQFLVARRALYDTVFWHRTARSAEGMVGVLLQRVGDLLREGSWVLADNSEFGVYRAALSGTPISVDQVLQLDDYSLWVLIMAIAERSDDPIAADLAKRIVSRDLFKSVPIEPKAIQDFTGRRGRAPLEELVADCCGVEDGAYYLVFDQREFETLSKDDANAVYLVGEAGDSPGEATLARDHHELEQLGAPHQLEPALYAPVEAIEKLVEVLRS